MIPLPCFFPLFTMDLRPTKFIAPLVALAGMLAAVQVMAASGSITIMQRSTVDTLGKWSLTTPTGSVIMSQAGETQKTIGQVQDGLYLVKVTPPEGAKVTITVYEGGVQKTSMKSTSLQAKLSAGNDYRFDIDYSFESIVRVDSVPSGMPFELVGPPKSPMFRGVTPAVFYEVPPVYYTAQYADADGCIAPKPQKREVQANQEIEFLGIFTCESDKVVMQEPEVIAEVASTHGLPGQVTVSLSPHQRETIPGSSITYTLTVTNHDKTTSHNLDASFQFDPTKMRIVEALPKNGTVDGNIAMWSIPRIYAGQSWSVTFPVQVLESVGEGEKIGATARISGEDIVTSVSQIKSDTTVGTAVLPATGERFDLLFAVFSAVAALVLSFRVRRRLQ